jgi:hypothetical protein
LRTVNYISQADCPENAAFPTDSLVKDSQKLLLSLGEEFIARSKGDNDHGDIKI